MSAAIQLIEDTLTHSLQSRLDALRQTGRLRRLRTVGHPQRPQITLDGQPVVDCCSNDYLGLSAHPRLIAASREALEQYGTGSGGSRLIGGTLDLHIALEDTLARFKGTEAALVFNSGYQANISLLSGLVERHDWVFADKYNHASLVDGAILSRAKVVRYPHLDMGFLENALKKAPLGSTKWIVTDTIFSMDGDAAPLQTLYNLARQYNAWLILDEAHATGIFGDRHRSGLWETTGIGPSERVIQMGTFSKALGGFGAYVAGSRQVVQAMLQFCRGFIYSTALPPAVIAANHAAVLEVMDSPNHTARLWTNIRYFESKAREALPEGTLAFIQSPIVPVILGNPEITMHSAQQLLDSGYYVQGIRPPTVPEGTSRLRITLSANHNQAQIDGLISVLQAILG